jgi:hypothetical protein
MFRFSNMNQLFGGLIDMRLCMVFRQHARHRNDIHAHSLRLLGAGGNQKGEADAISNSRWPGVRAPKGQRNE